MRQKLNSKLHKHLHCQQTTDRQVIQDRKMFGEHTTFTKYELWTSHCQCCLHQPNTRCCCYKKTFKGTENQTEVLHNIIIIVYYTLFCSDRLPINKACMTNTFWMPFTSHYFAYDKNVCFFFLHKRNYDVIYKGNTIKICYLCFQFIRL